MTPPTTNATLLFQSDFEDTQIVSNNGERAYLNWDINHAIWMGVMDWSNPISAFPSIDAPPIGAHSGTKALHMLWERSKQQGGANGRTELQIPTTRTEYYVSLWYYFPTDYSISGGWHEILDASYEYGQDTWSTIEDPLGVRVYVNNNRELFSYTSKLGNNPGDPYDPNTGQMLGFIEYTNVQIPLGEWFKISFYLHRDRNGHFILWLNDQKVMDIYAFTGGGANQSGTNIKLGKLYAEHTDPPLELWIDDLELYDTIP